jgi:hypothetical protein
MQIPALDVDVYIQEAHRFMTLDPKVEWSLLEYGSYSVLE